MHLVVGFYTAAISSLMKPINRAVLGIIIIILICWIDYQYFTEGITVINMNATIRRVGHLLFLALLIPIGYWGLSKLPKWISSLWLRSYVVVFLLMLVIGAIQVIWHPFNVAFLDQVSNIRLFFGSPLPYMILYVLYFIQKNSSAKS